MAAPNNVSVNVGALSNALAVAIQQATHVSATPTPPMTPSSTVSNPSPGTILPSYLKRKRLSNQGSSNISKRPKTTQFWDRDIICLPPNTDSNVTVCYPRGKARAKLGESGLIGKIRLSSIMTVEEVEKEVRSVFSQPMGKRNDFPFAFLQPTGLGSKTLTVPSVSASFSWTAYQVAKLGGHKQPIYILAQDELNLPDISEGEDNCFDVDDAVQQKDRSDSVMVEQSDKNLIPEEKIQKDSGYRAYVDLIDLTMNSCTDSEGSELDELPDVPISLGFATDSKVNCKVDLIVAKHILLQHQAKVICGNEEDRQRIHVRRSNLISDTIRAFSRPTFNVSKLLKVVFVGEPSVDEGGPRREFFQLIIKELFSYSGLFIGWPQNVVPVHNVEALAKNEYYVIGKIIATCLVHGGQPPVCFSAAVADYMVYNEVKGNPCISDVHDYSVRNKLKKVQAATTVEELRKLVDDELDFRFDCGYTKPTRLLQISDADKIVKAIWLHYVYFIPHAELEQLKRGLRETLQIEILMCLHPEEMHSFLVASSDFDITSDYLLDSFVIDYSESGSNKRTIEEAVILSWTDYIMECADRQDVSLADILHFISGSTKLPASGFDKMPKIHFTDDCILPKASTCDVNITFPRSFGKLLYPEFRTKLDMCILDSFGFGNP